MNELSISALAALQGGGVVLCTVGCLFEVTCAELRKSGCAGVEGGDRWGRGLAGVGGGAWLRMSPNNTRCSFPKQSPSVALGRLV